MKLSYKLPKLFLAIILFSVLLFPIYAMQEKYIPLSHYADFKLLNKSATSINIEVKMNTELIASSDLTAKLADEFNATGRTFLYQSKLIAIPEDGNVELNIKNIDSVIIPITDDVFVSDKNIANTPITFIGKSGLLRDIKVAPLLVKEFYYNETTKNIVCYKNVEIEIKFNRPPLNFTTEPVSENWNSLYRTTVLNYDETPSLYNIGLPQSYLIITDDAYYDAIQPFARWKNLKGYTITVKRLSEIGNTTSAIKNYITQCYQNFSPRLEYVLLVGRNIVSNDIYGIPARGDHQYACVAGNDLYPDLFVGRLPVTNTSELNVITAKILGYESTPFMDDTMWYRRALVVGTQYQASGDPVWTALATLRWVRNLLLQHNYLQVDTVFDPPHASGAGIIDTFVNRGVTFICGRGWGNYDGWNRPHFIRDDVANLSNGWKLPIVTSFYCGTANCFGSNRCFGEYWLIQGTPNIPKAAVGFYGPTWSTTSSRFNNCQTYGVYWGIFEEGIHNFGVAMFRGKLELFNNFPVPQDSDYLRWHVCSYTVLGDPSLEMWTAVPRQLTATYPTEIPVGSTSITVSVRDGNSQPIPGALVSLYKSEVKSTAFTDNSGNAVLNFLARSADTLFVTVTAHNYIPHLGNVRVTTQSINVGFYKYYGYVIAGQPTNLPISLKNYGSSQTANNTIATLRTTNNQITITDSVKSFGNINPGQMALGGPFQFTAAPSCTNNQRVNFQLSIVSGSYNWISDFTVNVRAPELSYKRHIISDGGNGFLDPGETANLILKIVNHGLENISNVSGILRCTNPNAIRVLDSIGTFGNINVSDSVQNSSDYFVVQSAPNVAFGRKFYFQLILRSGNYERTIEFPITIGNVTSTAVLGPDEYGYWAYDNTDVSYTDCPTYSWIEIDPNFGGSGSRIILGNDAIRTINLPFTFRYYGQNYSKLSICANGYVAMDSSWITDPYNWHIPSPMGPPAMIAPFWDDFYADTLNASGIYYYNDATNHRFIVEWSRIFHIHGFRGGITLAEQQTFQTMLYDQTYYPTLTGDGPIIFQYSVVANDDSMHDDCHNYATVGIENYEHTTGIEYTFAELYPPAAAVISNGRAIKFTTNTPDTFTARNGQQIDANIQLNCFKITATPNPSNSLTSINYSIPTEGNTSVLLYDANGRLIKTLVSENKSAGFYEVNWRRGDLPAGVYFVTLQVCNSKKTISKNTKLILY